MWNKKQVVREPRELKAANTEKDKDTQGLNPEFLDAVSQLMNVSTFKDQQGNIITMPNISEDAPETFVESFVSKNNPVFRDSVESDRMSMYSNYDQMVQYVSQCTIALGTYTDEVLGTGFVDEPYTIWSSDKKCQEYITRILRKNKFQENYASYVRSLLKYGDIGFMFHTSLGASTYDKEELKLEFIQPKDFKIFAEGHTEYKYEVGTTYKPLSQLVSEMTEDNPRDKIATAKEIQKATTNTSEKTECVAWDFCHWSVVDTDYMPYGRSLLDSMRTLADQKATMEVLMALGRASKIERILLEVTAPSQNPVVAMSQVQKTANTWKNMIMGADGGAGKNKNNNMGLTEVLTVPKGVVDVKKLNSNFDIAGTQDVEYFRDELITLSRVQKSSFLADQSINRGSTLEAQDLRFARALAPFVKATDSGLNKLCVQIALLGGFDLTKIAIKASSNRPAYVTKEYLQVYEQIANSAANLLSKSGMVPQNPEYNKNYTKLLRELGMPETYVRLMTTDYKPKEGEVNLTPTSDTDAHTSDTSENLTESVKEALGSQSFLFDDYKTWLTEKYKPALRETLNKDKVILNETKVRRVSKKKPR